jgi:translation elongation factor EF-Tu-like GTPase
MSIKEKIKINTRAINKTTNFATKKTPQNEQFMLGETQTGESEEKIINELIKSIDNYTRKTKNEKDSK